MKLEDAVCSLQQAKILKELGVAQVSLFFHRKYQYTKHKLRHNGNRPAPKQTIFDDIGYGNDLHGDYIMTELYSAFTVSEICEMLPDLIISNNLQYELVIVKESEDAWLCQYSRNNNLLDSLQYIDRVYRKTMAETVAYMLIHLLELGKVTAEECNKRLTDK